MSVKDLIQILTTYNERDQEWLDREMRLKNPDREFITALESSITHRNRHIAKLCNAPGNMTSKA